ncbi:phosphodiesterase [Rhizobium tubonense]|uniref:3',5'-cyclic-nucleotide phosphodiesterase n=1 Tax=Rhizobium tubonense TaxID=484088 RepID=A0A2W4CJ58_9HYPH|nr:phosphodiesterase [Rhizobium tubonense]PZM12972.1 3',5'-cyclic-nucleotide phosphodiesterase [Rhizobium tubonense]
MKIIHLSDIHMCPVGERVIGFDPAARLLSVIDIINTEHSNSDLCIVSGDLTDAGDETSYRRLKEILTAISVPTHLMLGNHDKRAAFRAVFDDAFDDGNGFVQGAIDFAGGRLVMLDTLDEDQPSAGFLCEKRLNWLENELQNNPEAPTLIFLHHPPFPLGVEYFDAMLLRNGGDLERLLDQHSSVSHVTFGHVHFPVFGQSGLRSFSASRGTCHPIRTTLRGMTATYVDRPPSYDVLLVEGRRIIVHPMQTALSADIIAKEDADGDGGAGAIEIFRNSHS